ncbi:MAG TPA: isocitrate/isopropylmalate family dehydrogenase [Clostridia bacterium]|nr:isocitrate/isopropylmalate family dehydrogenase [Clostridia bacterium]
MINITLIKGDGIGPEVSMATKKIIDATGIKINWDIVNAGQNTFEATGNLIPDDVYKSIEKNKIALKGPITTPIGTGFRSINVHLRKKYNLFANIRPIQSMENTKSRYNDIDFTIFRENTEGLYIGIENKISEDEVEAIKKVTTLGSERIIRKAFEYAKENDIDTVSVAHKANILKYSDGLFLNIARKISEEYPLINLSEVIIDNLCMQLVMNPEQYKIIVTMNLYGDIISDLGAGLIGGLGLVPGANIGEDISIFEAVHGSAPDIAGQNIANPTALLKSAIMMLKYIGAYESAKKIEKALKKVYSDGKILTRDLGGTATTSEFTQAIIDAL